MVTRKTKNIVIHVQGVPGVSPDQVKKAMSQLKKLILDFAGGKITLDLFVDAT